MLICAVSTRKKREKAEDAVGASADSRTSLALPGDLCTREPSSLQGLAQLILPVTSSTTWLHHRGVTSVIPGDTKSTVQGDPSITFKERLALMK